MDMFSFVISLKIDQQTLQEKYITNCYQFHFGISSDITQFSDNKIQFRC